MRNFIMLISFLMVINFNLTETFAQKKGSKKKTESPEVVNIQPIGPPTVLKVLNGDLLQLTNGEIIRLMGADAPVLPINGKIGQEPWASQAKIFTERLALDKEITINGFGLSSDEYGRRIGLVYIGELWLDYELVKQGFAVVQNNRYLDTKSKQELLDAQSEALTFGRGIWQTDNRMPLPPKEFRAANGLAEGDKPKDESWKNIVPKSSTRTVSNGNSSNSATTSNNSSEANESRYAYAVEILDSLKQLQGRLYAGGLSTVELSKLVASADTKVQSIDSKTDRLLAKFLRESFDAYVIVLDAFKRRETARDEERARLSKIISTALEIADKAIKDSESRLADLNKQRR